MYKIKLVDERYAILEQYSNNDIEIYSVAFEHGETFDSLEKAREIALDINNGGNENFTFHGNKKAVSIIHFEIKEVETIEL